MGYGDLGLANNSEMIFAIFAMIVGGSCFGYILGNVTSILENLNVAETLRAEKMCGVKEYLYERQFPAAMAQRVKRQLAYIYEKQGVFHGNGAPVLSELPTPVANALVGSPHRNTARAKGLILSFLSFQQKRARRLLCVQNI